MGAAAILILIFHFWMVITASPIEVNICKSMYIGVDIFFFVSAYSISKRKQTSFISFITNRLLYVYMPFVVMAILAAIYKNWSLVKLLKVVLGVDFFISGGGSFLWFVIAIMLLYLVAPFLIGLKDRFGWQTFLIILPIWLLLILILQFVFQYTAIFILLNRFPIFMIGLFYEEIRNVKLGKFTLPLIIAGLMIGAIITYRFCSNIRLSKPITDIYYLLVIPFAVSIVALFDYISQRVPVKNVPLSFVGDITLELYGMQMIFGYDIEKALFKIMKNLLPMSGAKFVTFVATACILILMAAVFGMFKKNLVITIKRGK